MKKQIVRITILLFLVSSFSTSSQAADVDISTLETNAQTFNTNNQKLSVLSGGNLLVSGANAVTGSANTGLQIVVNSGNSSNGISTITDNNAVAISGAGTLTSLNLTSGIITSLKSSGGTLSILSTGAGDNSINTSAGSIISNTATSGFAIDVTSTTNRTFTLTNAGSISASDNASSNAINLKDSNGGSTYIINNTGAIGAGVNGKAINLATASAANSINITSSGTITGAIAISNLNTATIANNTSGSIVGNISATTGATNITNNSTITGNILSTTGDLDISNAAGTITGNVTLGTNVGSTLLINGGSVVGNVTLGNAAQLLTVGGTGTLTGTVDGAGKVAIDKDHILNGNIGAGTTITTLAINSSKSLSSVANSNSIRATTVTLDSNSTLTIGSGAVTGAIQGLSDNVGTVTFNESNTLAGNVGISTNSLSTFSIANSKTIDGNTRGIDANNVNLGTSSTLNLTSGSIVGNTNLGTNSILNITGAGAITGNNTLGTGSSLTMATGAITGNTTLASSSTLTLAAGAVTGTINGNASGQGTLNLNATRTIAATNGIGQTNSLDTVNIANGVIITANESIAATNINIGTGISGSILLGASQSLTGAVKIGNGGSLTINGVSATVNGNIIGTNDNNGSLIVNQNLVSNGNLGTSTNSLSAITVATGITLDAATNNNNIDATTINLTGAASTLNIGTGTFVGNVAFGAGSITNIASTTLTGNLNGTAASRGTANINGNVTLNGNIGDSFALAALTIGSGGSLTLSSDVRASSLSNHGTLALGNSSKTITSAVTGFGSSKFNLGTAAHTISGSLTTVAGDTLNLGIISDQSHGKLIVSGAANIASGTKLGIDLANNYTYLNNGATITVVAGGSGSSINSVTNSNINVNSSNSNQAGSLTFTSSVVNNNLVLNVARNESPSFVSGQGSVYSAISNIGSSATGELKTVQQYLDTSNDSASQKNLVLKSLSSQSDNGISGNVASATVSSVNTSSDRLLSFYSGAASGDEIEGRGLWGKTFGTSARQDDLTNGDGYDAKTYGIAFGVDQEIGNETYVGTSISSVTSNINAAKSGKATDVNSYQLNIYGGKSFDKFFVNAVTGVALNNYSSNRAVSVAGASATSDYDGKTYVVKLETGTSRKLDNGVIFTPILSSTFVYNEISPYSETGAGTLNLNVNPEATKLLEGRVGGSFSRSKILANGLRVKPQVKASYGYNFINDGQVSQDSFVGQTKSFRSQGPNGTKSSIVLGASLDVYNSDSTTFSFDYDFEKRRKYQGHYLSANMRYDF